MHSAAERTVSARNHGSRPRLGDSETIRQMCAMVTSPNTIAVTARNARMVSVASSHGRCPSRLVAPRPPCRRLGVVHDVAGLWIDAQRAIRLLRDRPDVAEQPGLRAVGNR